MHRLILAAALLSLLTSGCAMRSSTWTAIDDAAPDGPVAYRIDKHIDDYQGELLLLPADHGGDLSQASERLPLQDPRYVSGVFQATVELPDGSQRQIRLRYTDYEGEVTVTAVDQDHGGSVVFHRRP